MLFSNIYNSEVEVAFVSFLYINFLKLLLDGRLTYPRGWTNILMCNILVWEVC